ARKHYLRPSRGARFSRLDRQNAATPRDARNAIAAPAPWCARGICRIAIASEPVFARNRGWKTERRERRKAGGQGQFLGVGPDGARICRCSSRRCDFAALLESSARDPII